MVERFGSQPSEDSTRGGPYLIMAAYWAETDTTKEVAQALREADFPSAPGFGKGQVVSFRHEVADSLPFRRDLAAFSMPELNERVSPDPEREQR